VLAATVQDGIFRLTDRGVRWTGWNFGLYDPNINLLAVADSQVIFIGTQSGIFRSTNANVPGATSIFPPTARRHCAWLLTALEPSMPEPRPRDCLFRAMKAEPGNNSWKALLSKSTWTPVESS
jgi:hypothetical protein